MNEFSVSLGKYTADVFAPESGGAAVYIPSEPDAARSLAASLGVTVAALGGIEWNRDMSPWPAKGVFRDSGDFTGGADEYISALRELIALAERPLSERPLAERPFAERGISPITERYIAGYSLAGLFAFHAAWTTELFDGFASMSGSIWYDRFLDRVREVSPVRRLSRAYFSLGDREKKTRNVRMAEVENATAAASEYLAGTGVETVFELVPGNHFADPPGRILRGLRWLTRRA